MKDSEIEFSDTDIKSCLIGGVNKHGKECIDLYIIPDHRCYVSITKAEVKEIAESLGFTVTDKE